MKPEKKTSDYWRVLLLLLATYLFGSCNFDTIENPLNNQEQKSLFRELDRAFTGINFRNRIQNKRESNIFNYRNFYNGGGVGIGDINNDGLPDIYLTSNLGPNQLYLNQGNFKFKNITASSGTSGERAWSTGVTIVDINADGLLDIYVSNAGNFQGDDKKNELFINVGNLAFVEAAEDYNLAGDGFTTHSAFFDYDMDGDLDVYMLNNSFIPVNTLNYSNKRELRAEDWNLPELFKGGGDKLLRNDNGKFVDVSEQAGIYGSLIGFGLGVVIADINADAYPDIYISNDFFERDYLYINNQDGTFSEQIERWTSHISMFSMGADIGDINNDGRPDIFVTDMLPEGDERLKSTTNFDTYDLYLKKKNLGFYNQSMHNTLQLNMGADGFHEIANYANVSKSDWSWGALMLDMDNDGYKDIFVCNGIYKDLTNQDFIDFFANDIIRNMVLTGEKEEIEEIINKMPSKAITNYAFRNNGDLTFSDQSTNWGFNKETFSNGATYGDLDNDGDLDLVINNVNQPVLLYQNLTKETKGNHHIQLKLEGEAPNTFAIGSKIELFIKGGHIISYQLNPTKGFQSSADHIVTLGLGMRRQIDSLKVTWPDRRISLLYDVPIDTALTLSQEVSESKNDPLKVVRSLFREVDVNLPAHQENAFVDFDHERLVSRMLSRQGPVMITADMDNDEDDDLYIGGSRGEIGAIYFNTGNARFEKSKQSTFDNEINLEDVAGAAVDIDNDGDLDLLISSGGNEVNFKQSNINRLYLNNGDGIFQKARLLPSTSDNVSVVAPHDYDGDGDIDVFIGARSVPGVYGINPKHLMLENQGEANFKNISAQLGKEFQELGMVTDASWANVDADTSDELILAIDWGSSVILKIEEGKISKHNSSIDEASGWWQSLGVADINNDGHNDLVLGNLGLNTVYKATATQPMKLYINDFDDNGSVEQILTHQIGGVDKPILTKHELTMQLPNLKKQNLSFADYAQKGIADLFTAEVLDRTIVKKATVGESIIAINNGQGDFTLVNLPKEAQLSSINDIVIMDVNGDDLYDIVYGGNDYEVKPQFARLDASFGGVLLNNHAQFDWMPYSKSGFLVDGKITSIEKIKGAVDSFIIVGVNDRIAKVFALNGM